MKSRFFLIGIILCIYSCSFEEDSGYYSDSFGVVKLSSNNTLYITSDEGKVLIPDEDISSFVMVGDRVWASYTIEKENANHDTLHILPYRITRVMPLTLQNESKLNDVGIDLWTVWISQDFLTFDFRIRANDPDKLKEHKYALVSPHNEIKDTLFINFIHDDGGDNYGVLCRTAVALKLSNLRIEKESIVIAVEYTNFSGVKQKEYQIYKKQ
jgi:hypothetical protein